MQSEFAAMKDASGPPQKKLLKEKFVDVYETFFKGLDPIHDYENFWEELFLLKVNASFLERCVMLTSEEELLALKENLHIIFTNCVAYLQDESTFRVSNALQTLVVLLKGIFRKKFTNFGFSVINIIVGFENSDAFFHRLLDSIENILADDKFDVFMKKQSLELLLAIATGTNNLDENVLFEFLMSHNMFRAIFKFVLESQHSMQLSYDSVLLLVLLANYRKTDSPNIYRQAISNMQDQTSLQAIAIVISSILRDCNKFYEEAFAATTQASIFPSISGIFGAIGSLFKVESPEDLQEEISLTPGNMGAGLMMLYEFLYTNPSLCKSIFDTAPPNQGSKIIPQDCASQFFCFCSFLFQDIKDMRSTLYAKLCFLVLLCLVEQQSSSPYLHSAKMNCAVFRKFDRTSKCLETVPSSNQSLFSMILTILSEFILANLRRKLKVDLYSMCFATIHRALCYQRKIKARLEVNWVELWKAMIQFCNFISTEEMMQNQLVGTLATQAVAIFNFFITFGDEVLPRQEYDHLYCELIRVAKVFERMHGLALRHDVSGQLIKDLANIRTITAHFTAKIDAYAESHHLVSLSREQVFEVIRANYESLKLKFTEGLDVFVPYSEQPNEVTYFRQLVTHLVYDTTGRR